MIPLPQKKKTSAALCRFYAIAIQNRLLIMCGRGQFSQVGTVISGCHIRQFNRRTGLFTEIESVLDPTPMLF
jgi:hypothetical protein